MKRRNRWMAFMLAGLMLLAAACGAKPNSTDGTNGSPNPSDGLDSNAGAQNPVDSNPQNNPYGLVYAEDQTLNTVYNMEASTLHPYTGDGSAGTWVAISNLTEGLQTVDQYGNFIPGFKA